MERIAEIPEDLLEVLCTKNLRVKSLDLIVDGAPETPSTTLGAFTVRYEPVLPLEAAMYSSMRGGMHCLTRAPGQLRVMVLTAVWEWSVVAVYEGDNFAVGDDFLLVVRRADRGLWRISLPGALG